MTKITTRKGLVILPNSSTPAERSIEKRRLRKHYLLNVIREQGPLSRAGISKVSGFNLPSVSSLVDELISENLVFESRAKAAPRGRRPIPVQINESAAAVMGVEIGWKTTFAILMDIGGNEIKRFDAPTPALERPASQVKWVRNVIHKTYTSDDGESGDKPPPLCGIGIGMPSLVASPSAAIADPQQAVSRIRSEMEEELDIPIFIDTDARMSAMGSLWFGAGRRYSSFAVLKIGFGLGLGIVIDGRLMRGAHGFATEIGQIPMGEMSVVSDDGLTDCLQNVASGSGLARMAKSRKLRVKNVEVLAKQAREGNIEAQEIFKVFAVSLGKGISTIFNLFDPEAVILSGGVTRSADLFLDDVRRIVKEHTLAPICENSELRVSDLDVRLGSLGAAASVLHHIYTATHVNVHEVI